jgi:hypothetical protein
MKRNEQNINSNLLFFENTILSLKKKYTIVKMAIFCFDGQPEVGGGCGCCYDGSGCSTRMSGQRPLDGGCGDEHRGVWCHSGLRAAAATSCKAGLASSHWWLGSNDRGMVNSVRKHCIFLGRCRRCHRPWTSLLSLEASSRSSFTPSPF